MKAVETEGSTVDEAVDRALILLDLGREDVEVQVVRDATAAGSTVRVRVSRKGGEAFAKPEQPEAAPGGQQGLSSGEREEEVSRETDWDPAEGETAREILSDILGRMGLDCSVSEAATEDDGQRITLMVSGDDAALVIGRQGQTLDAVEFFVNRMFERRCPGGPHVSLDAEGYRDRRALKLTDIALQNASEVRRTQRPIALEPMSPRDRRSIHLALRDEPGIATRSEGEGASRYVVIEPAGPLRLGGRGQRIG